MTAPKPEPYAQYPSKDTQRPAYAAGLRHLADLIERGDAPFPYGALDFFVAFSGLSRDEQKHAARALTRALGGGTWQKKGGDSTLALNGMCGGVPIRIYVEREAVCERVVTGTREVIEEVRVGEDTRPVETVTRTVEDVEWICSPLLADDAQAVSA